MAKVEYVNVQYIIKEYPISIVTARKKMKEIINIYNIDVSRLPKRGWLPKHLIDEYFNVGTEIKSKID